ncbi:MAG: alanine racemase [Burkholderiaceae bacterium]|nr:alanine racemase [Burkholderiaceae bacterium]
MVASTTVLSARTHKGYPSWGPDLQVQALAAQGWNVLQADWPLPCAVLRQGALQHNLGWMQRLVDQAGVALAPHGKTTLSPELFRVQLDAGAWGITFASVGQLAVGVAHGVRRALIANQVLRPHDLQWLERLHQAHPTLQAPFWLDSLDQLHVVEQAACSQPLDVLVELGLPDGRTGCRRDDQALALARAARASPAVRLVGLACYEGLWTTGNTDSDTILVNQLMQRVHQLLRQCDAEGLFDQTHQIFISAGGSAVFDLVAPWLRPPADPPLSRPVLGLLRAGCSLTHDHGTYQRLAPPMLQRLRHHGLAGQPWDCGGGLQAALEVWAVVQSCPEPGLAILNAGKRDLSHDAGLPTPVRWCPEGSTAIATCPAGWHIRALNDQHAYLHHPTTASAAPPLRVGDRVALGISHPCTTFDKWRWMPLIQDDGTVVGGITTHF